jgi:hypothetical protein
LRFAIFQQSAFLQALLIGGLPLSMTRLAATLSAREGMKNGC